MNSNELNFLITKYKPTIQTSISKNEAIRILKGVNNESQNYKEQ